jgi:hypothetical protein
MGLGKTCHHQEIGGREFAGKHFWSAVTLIVLPPWRLTRLVPAILVLDDDVKLSLKSGQTIPSIKILGGFKLVIYRFRFENVGVSEGNYRKINGFELIL